MSRCVICIVFSLSRQWAVLDLRDDTEVVDCVLLGCEAVCTSRWVLTFRRNILPPALRLKKRWYPCMSLHGVTTETNGIRPRKLWGATLKSSVEKSPTQAGTGLPSQQIHKIPSLGPILNQLNLVRTPTLYLIHILIMPSYLRLCLPNALFPSAFPIKIY
jgi:hypothetical protein